MGMHDQKASVVSRHSCRGRWTGIFYRASACLPLLAVSKCLGHRDVFAARVPGSARYLNDLRGNGTTGHDLCCGRGNFWGEFPFWDNNGGYFELGDIKEPHLLPLTGFSVTPHTLSCFASAFTTQRPRITSTDTTITTGLLNNHAYIQEMPCAGRHLSILCCHSCRGFVGRGSQCPSQHTRTSRHSLQWSCRAVRKKLRGRNIRRRT